MNALELREKVQTEAVSNPFLEWPETSAATASGATFGSFETLLEATPEHIDLGTHIRSQLDEISMSDACRRTAMAISWSLNEAGYLDDSLEDLADATDVSQDVADKALVLVQSCDPPGVAARSLQECLGLQLRDRGVAPQTAEHVLEWLPDIASGQLQRVSKRTGVDMPDLEVIATHLPSLDPFPGRSFSPPPQSIRPDLKLVRANDGTLRASLYEDASAQIVLSSQLSTATTIGDRLSSDLHSAMVRADQLVRAISFRQKTLLRVAQCLVDHQSRHLADPKQHVVPLTRQDLAQELGLHPSTIGRAVAGKAIEASGRAVALDALFSAALPQRSGSGPVSVVEVQRRVADLVRAEDALNPLTDDALADLIRQEGVDIARRTVTKYRQCLNIPSSFERKRRYKAADRRTTLKRAPHGRMS